MKLYVCSAAENMIDSIDGCYYLITEEGECLATHSCSSKWYAKSDLYERRPERIKEFTERFGECECIYLGEDDMTAEKILELNKKYFEEHPEKFEKQSQKVNFNSLLEGEIEMKQYTVENAYADNEKVSVYKDGKLEYYEVMYYWEVEGYCSALERQGYTKAYDVEKYKKELNEAEEEYNWATKRYSMAKKNPLVKQP